MEETNEKISKFQLLAFVMFLANGLATGIGIINVFAVAKQDSWIVSIVTLFFMLASMLIFIYTMNYKPDKTILEKNKIIFGKVLGNIVNVIICAYIFFGLILMLHSSASYATTMYLTKTPGIVISLVIALTAGYAVVKGIETIGRTSEILFFLAILLVGTIVIGLFVHFRFDDLKPILANGYMPIIKSTFLSFSYTFAPLIIIGIIPKNNIINNKNFGKYMMIGIALESLLMFFVFFLIPGVVTPKLASLYRFPAYYVIRKISIGGAINNVENFLSIHWFFNTFLTITLCIYFLSTYIKNLFKMKKRMKINIMIMVIGIVGAIIASKVFTNPPTILEFMNNIFPYMVSMGLLAISLITCLLIFIKKRREKKAT